MLRFLPTLACLFERPPQCTGLVACGAFRSVADGRRWGAGSARAGPLVLEPRGGAGVTDRGEDSCGLALEARQAADRSGDGRHVVVAVALAHQASLERLAHRA